jgi:RHS repeat-associated protein
MHTYENDALPSIAIVDKYYYDHAGRLLKQKQKINTQAEEVIAQNNYDDLGQLISKGVGGTSYQARLQNIDYTFNIRGWLKGINDPNNLGTDLFGFKLNYNTPEISGSTAMFNGNISETIWKTKNDETSTTPWVQRAYGYQYDPLNRITKGDFKIKNSSGVYVSSNYTEYSLSNVTYDKNGNIRTLRRYTNSGYYPMDDLTYSYDTGNKLLKVVDNGYYSIKDEGFKDGINTGNDYTYDGNGNLKEDKNKGIADIIYNYLNLPSQITFASGNIQYIYNATGTKQKKIVTEATGTTTTIYAGNYIYQNNALQMISQPEGYLEPNGQGGYDYGYRLKDHLGNIRLTFIDFDHNGSIALSEITEENNYYPFGLKHQGYNNTISSNTNAVASKFKYNGKELNDELGLDLYDYGARYHMLDLGRFTTQDALAEYYYDQSPYNYVANNPISFLDPDGNFRTKFGAWLWKTFNGGGDILQDKGGEYFVSQQVEYTGEGAGIAVKRTFDREGRREGKDLEFEAQKEAFLTQYEFKQTMESMGVEVYYTDDINEARSSMLQIPSMVVIPNVLKSATGVVNTAKQGGKINANSLKELKSLIQKLSKPSSELTKKELHQFTKLVEKYGGKIRKDLNPVKGKIRKPHVQVEGLGKSIENRHIWLKNGVN